MTFIAKKQITYFPDNDVAYNTVQHLNSRNTINVH